MKILLTGCSGYVGGLVAPFLEARFRPGGVYRTSSKGDFKEGYKSCDLRDFEEVLQLSQWIQPDVIVHAAGNKDIKFCEANETASYAVNVTAVENLIKAFGNDVVYIYISSDYIFEGTRGNYTEIDTPAPFTVYGRQKLTAEKLFLQNADKSFIVRLSALFNRDGTFCKFLRSKFQENEPVECYEDVFYSPTYYKNFLQVLNALLPCRDFSQRIFHCCGERVSRFDFATMYARHLGFPTGLVKRTRIFDSSKNAPFFLRPDVSLNCDESYQKLSITPLTLTKAFSEL